MTWEQVGPVVGVVVGALLAGFAQIVNDVLKSRREVRLARIEATRAFIEAFRESALAHQHAPYMLAGEPTPPQPIDYVEADWRVVNADERLGTTQAYLLLLDDSARTADLTEGLVEMVRNEQVGDRYSPWGDRARDSLRALIEHARR